jgi:hypothetical protein
MNHSPVDLESRIREPSQAEDALMFDNEREIEIERKRRRLRLEQTVADKKLDDQWPRSVSERHQ